MFNLAFKSTSLFVFLFFLSGFGNVKHHKERPLFNHMKEINVQWKKYKKYCIQKEVKFTTDIERIHKHLILVHNFLRNKSDISGLNEKQKNNREYLLGVLKKYAERKIFPTNHYHAERRPYFVDDYGVHCAVGYLIKLSGHEGLVEKVRRNYNYDYIKDIEIPELQKWADEHGFTVDELKWIQPGYAPQTSLESVHGGTNGTVKEFHLNLIDGKLIFGGEFTEVDNLPCLNIGVVDNNQLSCLGNGLSGTIYDISSTIDHVYAFGSFENNGQNYPIAKFENSTWSYIQIPGLIGATVTAVFQNGTSFEMAVSHPSFGNHQEILFQDNSGNYNKKAEVNGIIKDIDVCIVGRVFAGHFDTIRSFSGGILDSVMTTNNIAFLDGMNSSDWITVNDSSICDTVLTIENVGNISYFGGVCESYNVDNVYLSRYQNNTLQPLLTGADFQNSTNNVAVNDLRYDLNSSLIVGGQFESSSIISFSKNLAKYDLISGFIRPYANLDESVHIITTSFGKVYLGGDFVSSHNGNNLNHFATIESTANIVSSESFSEVMIFPNPVNDKIQISSSKQFDQYKVIDIQGKMIQSGVLPFNSTINVEHLSSGQYVLSLQTNEGSIIRKKIVKR